MKKLAIISSHPIQYNAPLFKTLAERNQLDVKVFYTWSQAAREINDVEFGKTIQWDIPLLEGYAYTFIENVAKKPGTKHFWGIDNPSLVYEIETWKPDAVLVYGWSFRSHIKVMRFFKGKVPVLFRGDSTLLNEANDLKRIARRLFLRWVYHYVDIALFVGKQNQAYFQAHGLSQNQLAYVPHVVDNNRFNKITHEQEQQLVALKEKVGIQNAEKVFLFVGKFVEIKNTFLLLDAFKACNFPEKVHLVFVGEGQYEKQLKEKSQNVSNVHFLPFQNQAVMPVIYRLGSVLVLPSKSETWGLAVNEALASGLAAIVSNKVGCAPDLIQEGKNGYIFKVNDKESLMQALRRSVNLPSEQIIQANQAALNTHNLETAASQIRAILMKNDG